MASILLTTLFDAETGFVGTLVISFLLGSVHGNEFDIAFITAFTGTVAVVSFRKIRLRRHFIFGGIYIALSYIATILTLGFLQYSPFIEIGKNILYATLNSLVSSVLAFGLIAIFEWFFDITTDITLLEYADLNNPVLKKLSLEAPGTFHHSILVGNLAEAAAEVIGANSLLARVGSYYHDIGKMEKPEYFVENQMGAENKHEKLSPSMSSLILASHVKTGVEIAEQYKLPKVLRNFIREHHGTSVMNYFYHKALEISEQNEVKDIDYRYPGPEPSSKETAIVMLADSVEAGTRSLQNPTVNRIRGLVESIVETKSNEGQLANCELTLKDLRKITEAFIPVLMAIFHVRV
jgi:putative nucleotidyltransferase with HDIG domain